MIIFAFVILYLFSVAICIFSSFILEYTSVKYRNRKFESERLMTGVILAFIPVVNVLVAISDITYTLENLKKEIVKQIKKNE